MDAKTTTSVELPCPPFFTTVKGINNLRDAGGQQIFDASGSTANSVRRNYIYRSAETTFCTAEGCKVLVKDLGVKVVFDLRSQSEIDSRNARLEQQGLKRSALADTEGVEVRWIPVFTKQAFDPESIAERYRDYALGTAESFARAYSDILANGGEAYRNIFEHVRDHPDQPFLVHCSAGKDRTGVIVAMLLSLAGVDDDRVSEEYALTELGIDASGMRPIIIQHLMAGPLKGDENGAKLMTGARKESMMRTLELITTKYGGAAGYIKSACGLCNEDVEKLRANLLATPPSTST